jgi:hypothetical protein
MFYLCRMRVFYVLPTCENFNNDCRIDYMAVFDREPLHYSSCLSSPELDGVQVDSQVEFHAFRCPKSGKPTHSKLNNKRNPKVLQSPQQNPLKKKTELIKKYPRKKKMLNKRNHQALGNCPRFFLISKEITILKKSQIVLEKNSIK